MLAVQRGIAESFPASGVTFNTIMPGPTLTDGVREMLGGGTEEEIDAKGREFVKHERSSSLLERLIDPEEVANLAVYLASEQASATTGAALRVDGGVLRAL
jgi:NAD(P)-dependent dehydrogenase (short-subunit alcohol dehydrogenase family)